MESIQYRRADLADVPALAELKSGYVQVIYRGFVPEAVIKQAEPGYYLPQFNCWIKHADMHLDIQLAEETPVGYVVYGPDPTDAASGLILESGIDLRQHRADQGALYVHALGMLAQMGFTHVNKWVVRDNFRLRFLLERNGFKDDGVRKMVDLAQQPTELARYSYRHP